MESVIFFPLQLNCLLLLLPPCRSKNEEPFSGLRACQTLLSSLHEARDKVQFL